MRERSLLVLAGFMVLSLWSVPAHAASADGAAEQRSLRLVNDERRERGLDPLRWHDRMASIARRHSADMASDGELRHNDDLPSQVGDYQALGENVGYGGDADSVHAAFMNSSGHRRIILSDDYTHVGIGVIRDGDIVWITEVFYTPRDDEPRRTPRRRPASKPDAAAQTSPADEPAPARQTARRAAPAEVRAQAVTPVRPVRGDRRARTRAVAPPRAIPRTLEMLEELVVIGGPLPTPTPRPSARPGPRPFLWA